jgi:diamine N-acetyltransferase
MNISIATKQQLNIVRDLAYKIWPNTYGQILAKEQLDYMLDQFYSIQSLETQLLKNNQVFLLAHENDVYYGFAAYELNYNDLPKTKIHKIYVLPDTQGKGIGKNLMNKIQNIAIQNNNTTLNLNVNRFNSAKDFYEKNGFTITETIDIEIGRGYLMQDYVMEKIIL